MSNDPTGISWQTHGQESLFDGSVYHDHSNAWMAPGIGDEHLSDDDAHELLGGTWASPDDEGFGTAEGWG